MKENASPVKLLMAIAEKVVSISIKSAFQTTVQRIQHENA